MILRGSILLDETSPEYFFASSNDSYVKEHARMREGIFFTNRIRAQWDLAPGIKVLSMEISIDDDGVNGTITLKKETKP